MKFRHDDPVPVAAARVRFNSATGYRCRRIGDRGRRGRSSAASARPIRLPTSLQLRSCRCSSPRPACARSQSIPGKVRRSFVAGRVHAPVRQEHGRGSSPRDAYLESQLTGLNCLKHDVEVFDFERSMRVLIRSIGDGDASSIAVMLKEARIPFTAVRLARRRSNGGKLGLSHARPRDILTHLAGGQHLVARDPEQPD